MDMAEYRAINAISASDIKQMKRSLLHWRYWRDNPQPSTPAQELGTAVHAAICEWDKFNALYVVFDDESICNSIGGKKPRATNAYRDAREIFLAENASKTILSPEDYTRIVQISKAVKAHPVVGEWLRDPASEFEKSLFWKHGNIPMKMRADHILGNMIIDYKTTNDSRPSAFSRTLYNFSYHLQGAVYCEGAEATGIADPVFILVAIETDPPHGIMIYELDKAAIEHSKLEIDELLYKYEKCAKDGVWTCYDDRVHEIELPLYAYSD